MKCKLCNSTAQEYGKIFNGVRWEKLVVCINPNCGHHEYVKCNDGGE